MGKEWDATGVAFDPETWQLVLRVLKPGAYLVAFGGTRTYHRMTCAIEDAGFEVRDCLSWLYGSGFPKSLNLPGGIGTALKPAWEPCVLARKPLIGTVAANVGQFGTGALNIDACRIGDEERTYDLTMVAGGFETTGGGLNVKSGEKTVVGRWPANVLLDEEAAALLDEQTGVSVSRVGAPRGAAAGAGWGMTQTGSEYDDMGGASRFYYVAKPSRRERDLGTDANGNTHPTVKPVEVMRWLVRLVTPRGGVVLDPFLGSGTTGVACVYEQREFVGIEREAAYVEIAMRRIAAVAPLFASAVDASV